MSIMHNGDYPMEVKGHLPTTRPSRRELSYFPVDTFDLRVHVLIGYMEEAVRRPITNHMLYNETDESDNDGTDYSSEEETSDYEEETDDDDEEETENRSMYTNYKDLASFFTEKDGTQEPYDVCVRFSYSPLPDDDDEGFSQATQSENDPAELADTLEELFPKNGSESVKKSKFAFLNCFRATLNDDNDDVKKEKKFMKKKARSGKCSAGSRSFKNGLISKFLDTILFLI